MESRGRGGSLENREEAELALKLCTGKLVGRGGTVQAAPHAGCAGPIGRVSLSKLWPCRGLLHASSRRPLAAPPPSTHTHTRLPTATPPCSAELLGSYGGEVESLVLLAPYSAQVSAFKRHVSANAALKGRVECSTVDGYQGREADVVIFSSVRWDLGLGRDSREAGFHTRLSATMQQASHQPQSYGAPRGRGPQPALDACHTAPATPSLQGARAVLEGRCWLPGGRPTAERCPDACQASAVGGGTGHHAAVLGTLGGIHRPLPGAGVPHSCAGVT